MSKKRIAARSLTFAETIEELYEKMKVQYDVGMGKYPDRNEASRRNDGINGCKTLMHDEQKLSCGADANSNRVLVGLRRRYEQFVTLYYSLGDDRFDEWYVDDWQKYLQEEHNIGDLDRDQGHLPNEVRCATKWSKETIKRLIATEVAYRRIFDEHNLALNPPNAVNSDIEPEAYVEERVGNRHPNAFDRFQCTAFIVTLVDALTRHNNDLERDSIDRSSHVTIHNLNMKMLSEAISLVSGLNADNIRKDIKQWRTGTITCSDNRLRAVRAALLSFDVEIDTTILDEALIRNRG
jgi:hypothetical protein